MTIADIAVGSHVRRRTVDSWWSAACSSTNGKAERFIQSSLREWTYARPFHASAERGAAMLPWIN
jgi:hypothetical protein